MSNIKELIKKHLVDKNSNIHPRRIAGYKGELIEKIKEIHLPNLESNNIVEKIYWVLNDLQDYPKSCAKCNAKIKRFRSFKDGYSFDTCSISCGRLHTFDVRGRKQKVIKTNEEKELAKLEKAEKQRAGSRKSLGVDYAMQSDEIRNRMLKTKHENWYKKRIVELKDIAKPLFSFDDYTGSKGLNSWSCVKCNTIFECKIANGQDPKCPTCNPPSVSNWQKELSTFIESLGFTVLLNDRKKIQPYEIDILVEGVNVGIECHGVFWHSEQSKRFKREHMQLKLNLANQANVRLIQVLEDEWIHKRKIVESRIKSILNLSWRVYARNTKIKSIHNSASRDFLNVNHIQGSVNASVRYGLFLDEELVAVMTFGKPRFNKEADWELLRYASKRNVNVIGGASKCLKLFIQEHSPKCLISYADARWSNGNLYQKLGFEECGMTPPNYCYVGPDGIRKNRVSFQKHKLRKMMGELFDESLTEHENAAKIKHFRIWDAGSFKFILKDIH